MRDLSSLELFRVISEAGGSITGSRIRKFYEVGEDSFRFSLYKEGKNTDIYCKLAKTFNTTVFAEQAEAATSFAMAIRKRISNSFVDGLEQPNMERILVFDLEHGSHKLIIEMFGKGNMVLVNAEGTIEACYKVFTYRDRVIKNGRKYEPPMQAGMRNFNTLSREELETFLESSGSERLIIALSKYINIGPLYLDDMLRRVGLDPSGTASGKEAGKIFDALVELKEKALHSKPIAYIADGAVIDYSLFEIGKYMGAEKKEYATMNELLDSIYREGRAAAGRNEQEEMEGRLSEIKSSIEKQERLLEEARKEVSYFAECGNMIFENMDEINKLIEYFRRNKRATREELNMLSSRIIVKEIDFKKNIMKIEMVKENV